MAVVEPVFLDTSILLLALLDFGKASHSSMRLYDAVAERRLQGVSTAWHCCLEFYSVATRLPMELRITPAEALFLLEEEILARLQVVQLPDRDHRRFLKSATEQRVMGGRIYDAHIAETAKSAGVAIVVTNNQRHFTHLLKENIRVVTDDQFVALL